MRVSIEKKRPGIKCRLFVSKHGTVRRYQNDKYHREGGPAINDIFISTGSCSSWWIEGRLHREDGPAVMHGGGTNFWYINGKQVSEDSYNSVSWCYQLW